MSAAIHVVIMAGGTGGHIFPALAVARELQTRGVGVSWLGTRHGLESRLVPEAGIDIDWLDVRGLRGNGVLGWLVAPWRVSKSVLQAIAVLRRRGAGCVLGMGGFAAGPGGVAAWLLRRPVVIHEQNSVAGLTNRLLSRLATRVLQGFPNTFKQLSPAAQYCGNPVRADIAALPDPDDRFAGRKGPLRLLVLGGSQGAKVINEVVVKAVSTMGHTAGKGPEVRHQTGERNLDATLAAYQEAGIDAASKAGSSVQVSAFIGDMAEAYGWADLVVCRAGALTIAELAAAGVGSVLVPYPYAVDDHQTHNAALLADAGAGVLKQEPDLDSDWLTTQISEWDDKRDALLTMARVARDQARPRATADVADALLATLGLNGTREGLPSATRRSQADTGGMER